MKMMVAVALLLSIFICFLLISSSFLEDYYIYKTRGAFLEAFETINKTYEQNPQDFVENIRNMSLQTGYKYVISDNNYLIKLSSIPEFKENIKLVLSKYQIEYIDKNKKKIDDGEILYDALRNLDKEENVIQLVAKLKNNEYLVITQPLGQLSDNVEIANDFILIIGIVLLIISLIATFLVSKLLVYPILDITRIAESIANLDFSNRYTGTLNDEIGILGQSINKISEKLDLTINQLKLANEGLKSDAKMQKRFIASVSHEFKTPVGLIRGYSESLNLGMAKTPQQQKEFTDIIIKEADRLNGLVNDLILIMHMDLGAFNICKKEVDIIPVLWEVVRKFSLLVKEKQVRIAMNMPEYLLAYVDSARIMQVIENLFSNSLRHVSVKGKIDINVTNKNNTVCIEIINSGSPIPENAMKNLFSYFYRVEDARSRECGGTGLGLAIVKGIVDAHSGNYGVENVDNGVMFWFEIPI
jgi:signal transduction histidine kinase